VNRLTSITGVALAAGIFSVSALAGNNGNGNGAPSGAHFNLNIIGVEKGKTADMDNSNGHVIFVSLGKNDTVRSKIWLTEGPFAVLDANGTDSDGAAFQLPANNCEAPVDAGDDPDIDCTNADTVYTVWVRALGKPGGSAIVNTCRTDTTDVYGDTTATDYCSTEQLEVTSETGHGKKKFENVTRELTTICVDYLDEFGELGQDGLCDIREQLFDYLEDYWWDYDNNGLRLAQLRFYMTP
jgi:hypothetical protein